MFLENLALKGIAVQSSTFTWVVANDTHSWEATKAIDGIRYSPSGTPNAVETHTYCSITGYELNPWWRLDLLDSYYIYNVTVTNRDDCCPEQTAGVEIRIGNSLENNGNNNTRCGVTSLVPLGSSVSFSCGGMEGRYVNMYIPNNQAFLTLCEVEVYGTALSGTAPEYLSDLLSPNISARPLRSSEKRVLMVPKSRLKLWGDRAFSVVGPKLWNSLPVSAVAQWFM
ncbi:fucolectin-like [Carassius auratus]|uniref:Fucolectin-like n=1 Tax=Carassius auratus TaxID=7957 RepID=A0A6P6MPV3_CARAU|nr:fucolectin-like [Carassius auratus]